MTQRVISWCSKIFPYLFAARSSSQNMLDYEKEAFQLYVGHETRR